MLWVSIKYYYYYYYYKHLFLIFVSLGNYYSIRSDHQMSISYFQRALKLNPNYLAAWTLMGHEFMELKNTNAAIQSYRKAVGKLIFAIYA